MTYIQESTDTFFNNQYFYYSYGIGRTLLATSLFITLTFNKTSILFSATKVGEVVPYCFDNPISIFCLLNNHLSLAKVISCICFLIIASGWHPRFTGILQWWLTYSFMSSTPIIDGGEHAATVISLFLIPVTLLDNRKWHWSRPKLPNKISKAFYFSQFIQLIFFQITRLQVALIYLHAGVGKTRINEWIDGTAIYYWFMDPFFGLNNTLKESIINILKNQYFVLTISWSVIILEIMLFVGFFLSKNQQKILLYLGVIFHLLILVIHGLVSFSIIMIGALFILLLQRGNPLTFDFKDRNFGQLHNLYNTRIRVQRRKV